MVSHLTLVPRAAQGVFQRSINEQVGGRAFVSSRRLQEAHSGRRHSCCWGKQEHHILDTTKIITGQERATSAVGKQSLSPSEIIVYLEPPNMYTDQDDIWSTL